MTRFLHYCLAVVVLVPLASTGAGSDYIGSETCAGCHQTEFEAWKGSHHDLAMQHATAQTVLGDFNDAEITLHGVTSRFFKSDGKFFVHTDGPDGKMGDFEVAFTFGVSPLQQYLVPFPDGRIQALSLAWDSRAKEQGGQRWFHLYPDQVIDHEDAFHWTGREQNWNYQCADCHSTNYSKGYDIEANRFDSKWSEIDVACEACHGPGDSHARWAAQEPGLRASDISLGLSVLLRDRQGVSWEMDTSTGIAHRNKLLQGQVELGVCADCHSRRGILAGGAQADARYLDHHRPAFLTESLYFPDGQIEDEVYVWGSFTQSKMHEAGVTCSDCHEPHSLSLRAQGDAVCAQCHLSRVFAVEDHHGHSESPDGPACVDCHMPERTYMVVDPRRDHSIRVPSPEMSARFGVPNACNQCHAGKTVEWAMQAFDTMFPDAKAPFQSWVTAFEQARAGLPQAEVSLLGIIENQALPELARATAVIELGPYLSPLSGQVLERALNDPAPLVRLAAIQTLEAVPAEHRFPFASDLLSDPLLALRSDAGRVLAGTPPTALSAEEGKQLQAALNDYIATQRYNGDRPESWINMGNVRLRTGDPQQAEKDYLHAQKLAPDFAGGYLNLADLYRMQGREADATATLNAGLANQPRDAALHHALGLSLIRSQKREAAIEQLGRAVELAPEDTRFAYVYGVALNSAGAAEEAVEVLSRAHRQNPNDAQLMQTLALFERDRGNINQARAWAEKMLSLNPADPAARQLLQSLTPDGD